MVEEGAFLGSDFLVPFMVAARSGAKAEARREDTWSAGQSFVMLSGKRGSSRTKTSDSSRRPSWRALFLSSFLRVSPRPSASPVFEMLDFVPVPGISG